MESTPTPPPWGVIEFTFSNKDTNSELVLMCNDQRFIVYLSEENFAQSEALRTKYLFFLDVAENYELDGYTVDDFYEWIVEPLLPILWKLPKAATNRSLYDFLYPETHKYTIRVAEGQLVVAQLERGDDSHPIFGVHISDDVCEPWPLLDPREVQIKANNNVHGPPSSTPSLVRLNDGSVAFLKPARLGDKHSLINEIGTYRKIGDASLDGMLNIPRLLGLVGNDEDGVFGLLLSYVDCDRKTLLCAAKQDTPMDLKRKWSLQITSLLNHLHEAGIVWGDVKPDNVLIDRNENAWLIDFGGGYTEGWVPKELAGSLEGDSEGLRRMLDFINTS